MGVLDEIKAERTLPRVCIVGAALEALPAEADEFRTLLDDPRYATHGVPGFVSSRDLHRAFARRGHTVSDQTIRRHRVRVCACRTSA